MLLRAEKMPDGMKGIFVSLAEGDVAAYDMVLDAQGKEVSRDQTRRRSGCDDSHGGRAIQRRRRSGARVLQACADARRIGGSGRKGTRASAVAEAEAGAAAADRRWR